MNTVIVLFNLKPGASAGDFEHWAREHDVPTVNALSSMDSFEVLRTKGLLIGDGKPPYEYIEIMRVPDMAAFAADLSAPQVQAGAAQFQQFADNPIFIRAESI
ncbi:REDY-like protein HapK [Lysobacter ciconiae]|uniref:REDY-like protein HapK n=1 Tax=Novilysobacter ciconiae TaxID=2781022 RepID=A0A7S6ZS36_9GAMM|nr:REDY-like protein HapK [Lysobacter ciconiae]QOW19458.1 REDY-like protein HapK [Lysobacter ciconiae]